MNCSTCKWWMPNQQQVHGVIKNNTVMPCEGPRVMDMLRLSTGSSLSTLNTTGAFGCVWYEQASAKGVKLGL